MGDQMEIGVMRAFVKLLETDEKVSVDARDKTRTLTVSEPARHVRDTYQTNGYYLGLTGYGTHYTLCVPDSEDEAVRLRYPQNPGLGEQVYGISRLDRGANADSAETVGVAGTTLVSDTTAADILDSGPEDDFR